MGKHHYQFNHEDSLNHNRFKVVYRQALSIFNILFYEQDDMFLVSNLYFNQKNRKTPKSKIYDHYLKNTYLKYKVQVDTLQFRSDDSDTDECYISQFSLSCRKTDINYPLLIKAACNEDFPLKPRFRRGSRPLYTDVYFINVSKNIIFFIYDDRGCEIFGADEKILRSTLEKCKLSGDVQS
ncbi:MAG: DUF3885 domain-containing protein [Bacillota bacterium]